MIVLDCVLLLIVHCRIVSLEIIKGRAQYTENVHCRIGSLEMTDDTVTLTRHVHCRIGSLEKSKRQRAS